MKTGKARKAAKAKRAAKHHAKQKWHKENQRAERRSVLAARAALAPADPPLSTLPPPASLSTALSTPLPRAPSPQQLNAALAFFQRHEFDPSKVLEALLADRSDGVWVFTAGLRELVVDEATRHALIEQIANALFAQLPNVKALTPDDEPKPCL